MPTPTPASLQRVLFVDDEPAILTGLSRMLRPLRHEIESEFVNSGKEALERLALEHFDIVIADIRMPGMDGAELLDRVQRAHPHVIRVVLSGHADMSAALRAVPVAHQFLAKPCDATMLRGVIMRAVGLHTLLQDRELQTLAAGMKQIPGRPETYSALSSLLASPNCTAREIAKLVSREAVLTAKLLQVVNSAFFGVPRRVTSIESAINYLGTSMLRSVVLATAANTSLGPRARELGYDLDARESHGLFCATLATQFFSEKHAREDAFAAALLQNVGELLLVAAAPESALVAIHAARASSRPLHELELELGAVSHAHMGAYLLGAWGLPYNIVEAVAHHHRPGDVEHDQFDIVDAVYTGTLLADSYMFGRSEALELASAHVERFGAQELLARARASAERWLKQPEGSAT